MFLSAVYLADAGADYGLVASGPAASPVMLGYESDQRTGPLNRFANV